MKDAPHGPTLLGTRWEGCYQCENGLGIVISSPDQAQLAIQFMGNASNGNYHLAVVNLINLRTTVQIRKPPPFLNEPLLHVPSLVIHSILYFPTLLHNLIK